MKKYIEQKEIYGIKTYFLDFEGWSGAVGISSGTIIKHEAGK